VCRNTLMYMNAETQRNVLGRLHFALAPQGTLFLGHAEMLLSHSDRFAPLNLKHRIFRKAPGSHAGLERYDPAATMYERDDFPLPFQTLQPTPFRQATEAVVAPAGQARAEWEVIDDLTRRMWRRTPGLVALAGARKALALFGVRLTPRLLVDAVIRLGEGGDRYGLRRGGLTFSRLAADHPHGKVLARNLRDGVLRKIVVYRGGRVRLRHDEIAAEVEALSRRQVPDGYPLRLIGMREMRSENSWMHNSPLLMRGDRVQADHGGGVGQRVVQSVDGDRVRIEVGDGGPGFDLSEIRPTSIGLAGLRERIESLGGTFEIDGAAPGTVVRMSLGIKEVGEA